MPGKPRKYDLAEIIQWRLKYVEQLSAPKESDDPMLAGGDSPALERYRNARADLAEMDKADREGRTVDAEKVKIALLFIADDMNELGEHYQRQNNKSAFDLLQQQIGKIRGRIENLIGDTPDD